MPYILRDNQPNRRMTLESIMFSLLIKCLFGALAVLVIALFSRSKVYYIAGLVPLFPTFALIAHVIVVQEQGGEALRKTALFGLWSLIPYAMYLLTVYLFATRWSPWVCLSVATLIWVITAICLVYIWTQLQ
ncbi:GlpM protein [Providencia rustigianii DSM 4541]|uniref:GlpM protein n=2 Tax=Providencia rustigianii TaxID=158850 RepID=D1P558_9GAMM|nr:GlpM protein [Providencia rustigianii DSM 4541]